MFTNCFNASVIYFDVVLFVSFLRMKEDDFFFRFRKSLFAENQVSAFVRFDAIFDFKSSFSLPVHYFLLQANTLGWTNFTDP